MTQNEDKQIRDIDKIGYTWHRTKTNKTKTTTKYTLFCRCLWFVCLRSVSCVPYFVDVSDLFVFVLCHVCPILSMSLICLSSSCVMCSLFCRCLWFVCLRPVSCVHYFVDVSDLFVFVLCHMCPILSMSLICLSSSCVTCILFCRCLCQRHRQNRAHMTQNEDKQIRDIDKIGHTWHRTKTNKSETWTK
jgi:hypothetical protein